MSGGGSNGDGLRRRTLLAGIAGGLAALSGCSILGNEGVPAAENGTAAAESDSGTATEAETATPTGDLRIEVPDEVLIDEAFTPAIAGLVPFEDATLEVTAADGDWRSTATYASGSGGAIDLGTQAPADGDFARVDPMGPVWSLASEADDAERFWAGPTGEHALVYSVESAGLTVTDRVTVRHSDPSVAETEVSDGDLVAWWYEPPGEGPHPAAVALHGSGANVMRSRSALLASRGVATLALQYFDAEGLPSSLAEVPVEYVQRAVDWVLDRDAVAGDQIGAYGVSRGGELALLLASRDDRVGAVVSDSGSHYVWGAVDGSGRAAWTVDGEPVPFVPFEGGMNPPDNERGAPVFREAFTESLAAADAARRREAAVPVEDADGPILFLSGTDDQLWPSTMLGNAMVARLEGTDFEHSYEHLAYRDAGHSIGYPYRPTTWRPGGERYALGGTPAAHAAAQADAWSRVVEFLQSELGE